MPKAKPLADWHAEDIKAAVRKKGWTLKALSLSRGLIEDACRVACSRPHYLGELAISEALGTPASKIWPTRFDAVGNRLHQHRTRRKPSASEGGGHRQKAEAA